MAIADAPIFLRLEGAPIPIGHGMAPNQPTKLDNKLMGAHHRVAEISHVYAVGTDAKKVRGVGRSTCRGVKKRECSSATAVVAGPHIEDAALAFDILRGFRRDNHIHVSIVLPDEPGEPRSHARLAALCRGGLPPLVRGPGHGARAACDGALRVTTS